MTLFAVRYGGIPRRPRVERGPVRPLEDIATENAAEGCVRETFGALIGIWQARFAGDPQVRRAMNGVARDESRHAALSWEVARWI
ncbi:MAG: ferritin-like domain-containing protein, partial [Polyangiaceae bacterium]